MNTDLIDLKIDFAFKLIFGREGQEPVLIAFLNAVLKPTVGKQIRSLTYTVAGHYNLDYESSNNQIILDRKRIRSINKALIA